MVLEQVESHFIEDTLGIILLKLVGFIKAEAWLGWLYANHSVP